MKNWLVVFAMAMGMAPAAQALEIEVHPLSLQARVEVMGVNLEADGQKALILMGHAASEVAELAGKAFDATTQMIIITGREVEELALWTAHEVTENAERAGRAIVIVGQEVTDAAMDLARHAIKVGKSTWRVATDLIETAGTKVVRGLTKAAKRGVLFFYEAGVLLNDTAVGFLDQTGKFICGFGRLFRIDLQCQTRALAW